jgi:hypothetical protein
VGLIPSDHVLTVQKVRCVSDYLAENHEVLMNYFPARAAVRSFVNQESTEGYVIFQ